MDERYLREKGYYHSPISLLIIIIISVFLAEALIMFILSFLHDITFHTYALLDATLLIITLSPILYFYGFRPLLIHIQERRRAEETTKIAYTELRQVFNIAADGIRLIDKESNIIRVNETFVRLSGFTKEELEGRKCYEVFPGLQCHTKRCSLRRVMSGEDYIEFEAERTRKDGVKIPCIVTAKPFRNPEGEIIGIVEDFKDITRIKMAEDGLKQSEEKLNAIISSISDYIFMLDKEFNITWANDILRQFFDCEIIGKKCYELFYTRYEPCDNQPCFVAKAFSEGKAYMQDLQIRVRDNTFYLQNVANVAIRDVNGEPTNVLVISRDITENKRLEQQLIQAQKMEAVGQLAGGIAHDFNNILTAIVGYAHLLQTELNKGDELQKYIDCILSSAKKAENLIRALLTFSRTQVVNTKPVNLNEIVTVLEKIFIRLIGEDIELSTLLSEEDLIIMADVTMIEQVIMNLVTNARDAMPNGGDLIIKTEPIYIDDDFSNTYGFDRTGKYAVLSVEDNGVGMDDETKERIFDPFFTTKEVGKGTGLGLAMVYGIVKQHNGFVNVYSELGKGTIFKIYLPLVKSEITRELQLDGVTYMGGNETIFVIEDDLQVRSLTKKILERAGYRVLEAGDGQEAVDIFSKRSSDIDLVILDVIMPKKTGKEVYEEIRKYKPDIRVLFTSGYTTDIVYKRGVEKDNKNFLLKPISPQLLLKKVRELIGKDVISRKI
jgi:two-component system NtrC family sensor kinase